MFYYGAATQQSTNGTANTDTSLANLVAIAGLRAALKKLMLGTYVVPADNAVRIQVRRSSALTTPGTTLPTIPAVADAPAASSLPTTLPTAGTITATPVVQSAFNQRGTAMWAAFNEDEAIGVKGATAPNGEIVFVSQSTGISVPVSISMMFSE